MNKIILLIAFSILITGHTTGCARRSDGSLKIPLVYRIDIQQGNIIDQSMISRLEPGMSKSKVRFVMGTPLLVDPFHSDRWDYIYSLEPDDGERVQRRVAVFFKNDKLTHLEGDITPGFGRSAEADSGENMNIIVPTSRKRKGFFSKWFGSEDEIKKADETRDEENKKELEALADDVKKRSEGSLLPIPERDAEQIERDFEVLEQTEESL